MAKKIMTTLQSIGALLLIAGCSTAPDSTLSTESSSPERNWVVIDVKSTAINAPVINAPIEIEFKAKNKGKFVVQLIGNSQLLPVESVLEFDGQRFSEKLIEKYVIDTGSVYEFKTAIRMMNNGLSKISINTQLNVQQIRIIPHQSNDIGTGLYHDKWLGMHQSQEKQQALSWFKDARFGMFIHWGLYSEAGGKYQGTRIEDSTYPGPRVAEWLMSTFQIPRAEYREFAKSFNPNKSFAQNIAHLAKNAGMKYVVITSKHHDGFALFNSKVSEYDIVDASPYQGDLIKELYEAVLAEGLDFGVYYSHGNDWNDGTDGNYANVKKVHDKLGIYTHRQGKNHWDPSANTHDEYLNNKAYPQIQELLTLLPKLRIIWFDGNGLITEKQAFDFYKNVYDTNPNVLVNRRVGYQFGDYLDAGDNVIPSASETMNKHWETVGTTNNSWGYKSYDHDWKSTTELLYYFIDILSKGGNYMLNIGPDGLGNVPEISAQRLNEMGQWINTNSDAIYGTKRWDVTYEGANETLLSGTGHRAKKGFSRTFSSTDFWFTTKENKVYAMSLVAPEGTVRILSMQKSTGKIKAVRLLGSDKRIDWKQTKTALEINSSEWEKLENGFAIEIALD